MAKRPDGVSDYHGPAGGWGALKALAWALKKEQLLPRGNPTLLKQNQSLDDEATVVTREGAISCSLLRFDLMSFRFSR